MAEPTAFKKEVQRRLEEHKKRIRIKHDVEGTHDGRPRDDGSMLDALEKAHPERKPKF
jgi:hypothetical protein